jgi:TonB family protein
VLFAIAALRAPAQDLSGQFTGAIYDPSRAVVPKATIVVTNRRAGTIDMSTSDAEGKFQFKGLAAADYEVQVLKPGFKACVAPSVILQPGRDLSLDFILVLGSVTEEVHVTADGPSRPPDSNAKPGRIRTGGTVMPPQVVTRVLPIYPPAAKAAGIQGSVILHAIIGIDGRALSIVVRNSQIDPQLARSAVEAVSQWRYTPTLLNGEPVEVETTVTVNFNMH